MTNRVASGTLSHVLRACLNRYTAIGKNKNGRHYRLLPRRARTCNRCILE